MASRTNLTYRIKVESGKDCKIMSFFCFCFLLDSGEWHTNLPPAILAIPSLQLSPAHRECFLFLKQNHQRTSCQVRHGLRQQKDHRTSQISQTMDQPIPERPRSSSTHQVRPPPEEPDLTEDGKIFTAPSSLQGPLPFPKEDKPCAEPARLDRAALHCHMLLKCPVWTSQVMLLLSGMLLQPVLPWEELIPVFSWTLSQMPSLPRCAGLVTRSTSD